MVQTLKNLVYGLKSRLKLKLPELKFPKYYFSSETDDHGEHGGLPGAPHQLLQPAEGDQPQLLPRFLPDPRRGLQGTEREFFIDNLLVRIHLIIEMILVDRPCAMGF